MHGRDANAMKGRMRAPLIAAIVVSTCACHADVRFEKKRLTDAFHCEGASAADFNRDGTMDVVAGPYWYEGPDFGVRHEYSPVKTFDPAHGYSDNFFAFTYDFDGDGWSDILIIGFPGTTAAWYENPRGAGNGHWPRHLIVEGGLDNESPTFTDLTGDGKPELVYHTRGRLGYAAPEPADPRKPWTFHPLSTRGERAQFTHGLGVGDVNGDRRADVIEHDGWWEQPASLDGEPVWEHHATDFGPGGAQMYAYDVDGDGLNDVIASLQAHGWGLAWFKQARAGEEVKFDKQLIMSGPDEKTGHGVVFSQLHAVELADVNGDGLMDVITGKRFWAHGTDKDPEPNAPAVLYWFELVRDRDGSPPRFVPHQIDDDSGVGTQVVARDVNGDGRVDVIVGNKKGTFVFTQRE